MRRVIVLTAAVTAVALAGCDNRQQLEEIRREQAQIKGKIDEVMTKLDKLAAAKPEPARQQRRGPEAGKVHELPAGKSAVRGPANAPVSIVEFSDYQCPFCSRSEPIIAEVLKAYPDKVNFVYKHFPLTSIHKEAMPASKAAVAAQKQGKGWEMHDKLFQSQRELSAEKYKAIAKEIGLDLEKFEKDMNAPETAAQVQEDMALASKIGVAGTPTIFVGGKLVENRSVEGIKALVEEQLKAKGAG